MRGSRYEKSKNHSFEKKRNTAGIYAWMGIQKSGVGV